MTKLEKLEYKLAVERLNAAIRETIALMKHDASDKRYTDASKRALLLANQYAELAELTAPAKAEPANARKAGAA